MVRSLEPGQADSRLLLRGQDRPPLVVHPPLSLFLLVRSRLRTHNKRRCVCVFEHSRMALHARRDDRDRALQDRARARVVADRHRARDRVLRRVRRRLGARGCGRGRRCGRGHRRRDARRRRRARERAERRLGVRGAARGPRDRVQGRRVCGVRQLACDVCAGQDCVDLGRYAAARGSLPRAYMF
jgi:hypothetical protein